MTARLISLLHLNYCSFVKDCLGHAPTGIRRTKPPPLAAEGQQHLMLAGITAEDGLACIAWDIRGW